MAEFVQAPKEILSDRNITAIELRLYLILMEYGFERGYSQAGHKLLSHRANCHVKTVAKSLKRLQELGYITIERIGLNRPDKIRAKKTVKRDKNKPNEVRSRRESKLPIKTSPPKVVPTIVDRIKNYTDIEEKPPQIHSGKTEDDKVKSPYLAEQDVIRGITTTIRGRETSLLPDCVVIDSNTSEITVKIPSAPIRDYVKRYQTPLIENVVGKKVQIL